MPSLVWDNVGDRSYETGLDKGVLYLPNGLAVPWNGLTSIIENFDRETSPVYYDGMKINDFVTLGDFAATMTAITYPDEFIEVEGAAYVTQGFLMSDQRPQAFGLCYRTRVGNDVDSNAGYKLHIIYNVTAIPSDKEYRSISDSPALTEFEWSITAVPEDVPGYRPTAHIIIDSTDIDVVLLQELEKLLYGSSDANAALIPMPDLVQFVKDWYQVRVVDNGDGTWTAIADRDGYITFPVENDLFEIININVKYLDTETFVIYGATRPDETTSLIHIVDNNDGTWSATSVDGSLIVVDADGNVDINSANVVESGPDYYMIADTPNA